MNLRNVIIMPKGDEPRGRIPTEGRFAVSDKNVDRKGPVAARVIRGRIALHGVAAQDHRKWDAMQISPDNLKGVGVAPMPVSAESWNHVDGVASDVKVDTGKGVVGAETGSVYRSMNAKSGGKMLGAHRTTGDAAKDRKAVLDSLNRGSRDGSRDWMNGEPITPPVGSRPAPVSREASYSKVDGAMTIHNGYRRNQTPADGSADWRDGGGLFAGTDDSVGSAVDHNGNVKV